MSTTDILLSSIIQSPRALKALAAAGWETMGDVEGKTYADLISTPGIGDGTVTAILTANESPSLADAPEVDLSEPEEGDHPIKLDSPYNELRIRMNFSDEIRDGKRVSVKPAHWMRFTRGYVTVKKSDFAHTLFPHSRSEQHRWMRSNAPWRVECINYLKALRSYKRGDFVIQND